MEAPLRADLAGMQAVSLVEADLGRVDEAMRKAREYLLKRQDQAGYWSGELEADASVSAGYISLMYFLFGKVDPDRQRKAVNYVLSKQNLDGSWSTYYGGAGDLSVSIQVYLALKLAGVQGMEPPMQQARDFILAQGGINRANVFTKIWLAVFGQYDWGGAPSVPPEIIYLPRWFYLNIYEFASWSRATIMALSVVLTQKPVCPAPERANISELFAEADGRSVYNLGQAEKLVSWKRFFLLLDRLLKAYEKLPFHPGRRLALKKVETWIEAHQETDGSWGGIMLPWIYSLIALISLGHSTEHPAIRRGIEGLEDFIVEDGDTLRLQPAVSPVWDTAWAMIGLRESGLEADHPALQRAAQWLLRQEIRRGGDWQIKNPDTRPGGWAFEFKNEWYPDLDDSAVVPRALEITSLSEEGEKSKSEAIDRALRWVVDMQSKDGGWAAFDRDNDKQLLNEVPFADFMSPLDPTCPDVTAHVIELLSEHSGERPALERGLAYIKSAQESDGAWYGRWGVNYLYGTGLVLASLRAAGEDPCQGYIQQAVAWLVSHQNPDGGWGETCLTYQDPSQRGHGPSTASQTAWALTGLIAANELSNPAVRRGIEYLISTQQPDGGWVEEFYTGTGFPRVFYLRYDLYRIYFPLISLARYRSGDRVASD